MSYWMRLLELLRDPIWQSIGVFVGAASGGLSFLFFLLNRRGGRKAISLEIVANAPLFRALPGAKGKPRIFDGTQELDGLRFIQYKVQNTGRLPIVLADIHRPIQVLVASGARVLEHEIISLQPDYLDVCANQVNDFTIELLVSLLNPGDLVIGRLVAADCDGHIRAQARISGVNQIRVVDTTAVRVSPHLSYGLIVALSTSITAFLLSLAFGYSPGFAWLFAGNLIAYALVGWDKFQVVRGRVRVPEVMYYLISAFGGAPGILLGTHAFNHKRRKRGFQIVTLLILATQCMVLGWVLLRQ